MFLKTTIHLFGQSAARACCGSNRFWNFKTAARGFYSRENPGGIKPAANRLALSAALTF
jgi:hypothetical protein